LAQEKIKAVLFDLGETLLNFGRVSTKELFRQGARNSYEFLKSCGQRVGSYRLYHWRNLAAIRLRHLLSNLTAKDFDALELLKRIGTRAGYDLTDGQWRQLGWLWYEPLGKLAEVEPDLTDTLGRLKSAGLKLGIVSNTFISGTSLDRHLGQLGILDFFGVRLYSYQFTFRKPNIQIFHTAADRIAEAARNVMFVGDRIDKDIIPAMKAGMRVVLKRAYTNTDKKAPQGIPQIDRISELPALIAEINSCSESAGAVGCPAALR